MKLFILRPKHELFCQEYLIDANSKQAAIRAGYSKKAARWTGPRIRKRMDVTWRILELIEERQNNILWERKINMGRPSKLQKELTEKANIGHQDWLNSFETSKKEKVTRLTSTEQIPGIFFNRIREGNILNKDIQEKTGKDKGAISRLMKAENMQIKTFLDLCNAIGIEIYIRSETS